MISKIIPILPQAAARSAADEGVLSFATLPPLSLYIHVPWCVRKCPYCDFNSHAAPADIPEKAYVEALIADLESSLPLIWGRRIVSVFFGGGTPSLLSEWAIDTILSAIRARLVLLPDAEITLEANPGTLDIGRFRGFASSGVNRLSLGVQSFQPQYLSALGRIHSGQQAIEAAEAALAIFPRVNLDLMVGLPQQTVHDCALDLQQAFALAPEHLSVYQLTLEPNTQFAKYPPQLPEESVLEDIQTLVENSLLEHDYQQYEVSAYARAGRVGQHNCNYWEFGDYLGIGPGAHGKLTFPGHIERHERWKQPEKWLQEALVGKGMKTQQHVALADLPFEFMMNALRLKQGVPAHYFTERTGLPITAISSRLQQAQAQGFLTSSLQRIQTTPQGFQFLNDVVSLFLPQLTE